MLPAAPGNMNTGGSLLPGFIVTQLATGDASKLAALICTHDRAARTLRNSGAVSLRASWSLIEFGGCFRGHLAIVTGVACGSMVNESLRAVVFETGSGGRALAARYGRRAAPTWQQ